jgi:predicted nucleotidyltransferase
MAVKTTIRKKLSSAQIKRTIAAFKIRLLAEQIPVKQMFLFGSYAKKRPHIDSDIDVAIVLDSKQKFNKNKIDKISWWAKQINVKLEPHILSENDFANRWLSLPDEIKKFGIEIEV